LVGVVSVNFKENETFNSLASRIAGYNPERFEAVALKVYIEQSPVVTIYAVDKQKELSNTGEKLPVKKFKLSLSLEEFAALFSSLNFTATTGEYDIDNMEVINR
jgi:hypothetical protein